MTQSPIHQTRRVLATETEGENASLRHLGANVDEARRANDCKSSVPWFDSKLRNESQIEKIVSVQGMRAAE